MSDLLPAESTNDEREHQRQQALTESARNLSVDERYILRRLASVVAQAPASAGAGVMITLPVAEFATHAGITPKVALRRLDVATHSIFRRIARLDLEDGTTIEFVWADTLVNEIECFKLRFYGTFIGYLLTVLSHDRACVPSGLITFSDSVNAPATVNRGDKLPYGLPIAIISRLKARKKRPKAMSMSRLLERLAKRLKNAVSRDGMEDIFDVIHRTSRWSGMDNPKYYKFTYRDLNEMHDWIIKNMDKPGFFDE